MKKLLFVMAFVFISHQAFSQMYIVTISAASVNSCTGYQVTLTTYPPTGGFTHTCISRDVPTGVVELNQTLNSIISQGYKLIETSYHQGENTVGNSTVNLSGGLLFLFNNAAFLNKGATFILAIP